MDPDAFVKQYLGQEDSYRRYFERKLDDVEAAAPQKGELLDVGCGPGILLEAASARGWRAVGVDVSPAAATAARARGVDVVPELPARSFDAVTAFQMIEHVEDPAALLRDLHERTKPGGILVVTTPDGAGLLARLMGPFWFGHRNPEHRHVFDKSKLAALVEHAGFEILRCTTEWGRDLDAAYAAERLEHYYGIGHLPRFPWLRFREPWANIHLVARRRS